MTKKVSLKKRFLALTTVAVMAVTSLVPTVSFAKRGVPVDGGEEVFSSDYYNTKASSGSDWTSFNPTVGGGVTTESTIVATSEAEPHAYALEIPGYYDAAKASWQYGSYAMPFHTNRGADNVNALDKGLNYKFSFQFNPTSTNYAYTFRFVNQSVTEAHNGHTEPYGFSLFTVKIDKDGTVKACPGANAAKYSGNEDVKYIANDWNKLEIYLNRDTNVARFYLNGSLVSSVDYGAWIKSTILDWRETLPKEFGRLQEVVVVRGSDETWYNAEAITDPETELPNEKLWVDDLEVSWISSGCYGVASYNNTENTISVNLTEPVMTIDTDRISIMKADGTAVAISDVSYTIDHKSITITPETALDANTEYVISLPDDMTTMDEKQPYASELFFTTPNSSELIYRVNEDFEGTFTPSTADSASVMTNGATVFSTAYRTETGVSDTEVAGENNKVLKMTANSDTGHAGLAFNLEKYVNSPTFNYIANDFSIEFDLYHPDAGRIEGAADKHWGWYMRVGHSKVNALGDGNWITLLSGGDSRGNTVNQPVFGISTDKKVGAPYFAEGYYTASMDKTGYNAYKESKLADEPIGKWVKYRLDFTITKSRNTCEIAGYMNDGTGEVSLGKWPIPLNAMNSDFVAAPRVGYFEIRLYGKNSAWQNRPVIYLDNLKVWERNRPEAYIETISVYDIENNEEFGPMSTASDTVNKLKLKFTDAVTNVLGYKDATAKTEYNKYRYSEKFSVVDTSGSDVAYTLGSYDAEDNSITLTFNEMLKVGKEYTITVTDLWNVHGAENGTKAGTYYHMPDYKAKFIITPDGQISVKNISLEADDAAAGTYKIVGDVKNTMPELKTVKTIISEYENDILTKATVGDKDIAEGTYQKGVTVMSGITPDATSDLMKAFILDGFETIKPISIYDTVDLGK